MSDNQTKFTPEEQQPSYTPASFEKRTLAWVGVACMVMLVLAITLTMALGKGLSGTGPLFLVPVSVGAAVIAVHRLRQGLAGKAVTALLLLLCLAAFVLGLMLGVPNLLYALEGL